MKTMKRLLSLALVLLMLCGTMAYNAPEAEALHSFAVQRQNLTQWKSVYYGAGNLYDTGCGIFSLVNAVGCLTGKDMGVKNVAQFAYDIGAYNNGGANGTARLVLYPKVEAKYGATYGFKLDCNNGDGWWAGSSSSVLKNHLLGGGVAVGHVPGHFIAILEYNSSNNTFHVYDSYPTTARGTGSGDAWVTASQLATNKLKLDWFCLLTATSTTKYQSCMDAPSGSSVANGAVSASLSLTHTGGADTYGFQGWTVHSDGVSSVRYNIDGGAWTNCSTWLRTDVQAAIGGYNSYANSGFSGTLNFGKIGGGSHTMTIQGVTTKGATYTVAKVSLSITDPIKPSISNVYVSNVTKDGYRVNCTVSDNCAVTSVRFPTWTATNGQDDIVWHDGTISGNTAYYDVKVSEHNNEYDNYSTHIYVYDAAGNSVSSGVSVNLSKDTTSPTITDYAITNITEFGFDVSCKVADNIAVTKVQFPTWTEVGGQDDIVWYNPTVSGGVASIHINTKDHGYQTGAYNVHLYAWDAWSNPTCVTMSVTVPTPVYPTDSDYIPLEKINATQNESSSQLWTTGTFTGVYWGVASLSKTSEGWKVTAKYDSGAEKSVVAGVSSPIIAVHSGHSAYAAYSALEVGAIVELSGVNLDAAVVLANANVKLPYSFALVDASTYSLDNNYINPNGNLKTAAEFAAQFKCTVSVYSASGVKLAGAALCGTGCVVKKLNSAGEVTDSATVVVDGDVNGDGQIGSADYITAFSVSCGTSKEFKGAFFEASDLNNDGQFSGTDCIRLQLVCTGGL